jgi:hypothetical protein
LTNSSQTWGASATEAAQFVHGYWDADGDYLPIEGFQRRLDLFATGAYRVVPPLELSLSSVLGTATLVAPGGFSADSTGFGDTVVRARWEVHEAPMPHARSWVNPALAVIASISAPTATDTTAQRSHPTHHGASQSEGLGTWEGAVAVDLSHVLRDNWQIGVLLEGALRAPDESFGAARWLGPRVLAQATLGHYLFRSLELGVLADIEWEGDATLAGCPAPVDAQSTSVRSRASCHPARRFAAACRCVTRRPSMAWASTPSPARRSGFRWDTCTDDWMGRSVTLAMGIHARSDTTDATQGDTLGCHASPLDRSTALTARGYVVTRLQAPKVRHNVAPD